MTAITRKPGGFEVRLRYGKGQRGRFLIATESESRAVECAERMSVLAMYLGAAVDGPRATELLREAAAVADSEKKFAAVERVVGKICREAAVTTEQAATPQGPRTFSDVAALWMSNRLHDQYPDQIRKKVPTTDSRYRAALAVLNRSLGRVPVASLTLEQAEQTMSALPPMQQGTRRIYALIIRRVMGLAEWPLRLIERSPIPAKFVPKQGRAPAFAYLYPAEEAALASCPLVPFADRLLYGVLAREGLRISEATSLTWGDLDLVRGRVTLDRNKTHSPRAWELHRDVVAALAAYRGDADPEDLVFPEFVDSNNAKRFREQLQTALEHARLPLRKELFARTAERRPIRIHDLRGTFTTLALASGRTETWVMDRTGHTTSQMLNKYRRVARTASETERHWLAPLDELLVAGVGQGVGHALKSSTETAVSSSTTSTAPTFPGRPHPPKTAESASGPTSGNVTGPATLGGVGPTGPEIGPPPAPEPAAAPVAGDSPVERALAFALDAATRAERWDVVLEVTRELSERRRARVAPEVPSLSDARKRRDQEGGK
jgi:integrase